MQDTFKRVNQQTAAVNNRQLVIQLLEQHGELSRSQLVDLTGLRGSTLTYITRELLQMDMLKQAGQRQSTTVGQKQQLLQVNPAYGWTIGVDVRVGQSQAIIMDAAGDLIGGCLIDTREDLNCLGQTLKAWVNKCTKDFELQADRLLGIGLGVSGIVDVQKGMIVKSIQFNVRDLPLAEKLTKELGVPVGVDHDANCIALAEQKQGNAQGLSDFIVLILDDQVHADQSVTYRSFGAALVLDGKVHRGIQFAAGELDSTLMPTVQNAGHESDLQKLAQESAELSAWLVEVASQVGFSMSSLVNLLDPQAVLLAGDRPIVNKVFVDQVQQKINQHRIGERLHAVDVVTCAFTNTSCARGAALATRDTMLANAVANHAR